jgi:hypothetical protein
MVQCESEREPRSYTGHVGTPLAYVCSSRMIGDARESVGMSQISWRVAADLQEEYSKLRASASSLIISYSSLFARPMAS